MVIDTDKMEIAEKSVAAFDKRFRDYYPNGDHMQLIQLAAFPVAVTVHLLYQLWANFNSFEENGVICKIDAMVVNDCILSNLFRQTSAEVYELEAEVRHFLLLKLRLKRSADEIRELANFLYQYSRHNTMGASWNNYYDAQQWTAIMEIDKQVAANEILESLAREVQRNNTSRGIGIANLISTLQLNDRHFANLVGQAFYDKTNVGSEKQLVVSDQNDGQSIRISISLPPVLSNKLSKVVSMPKEVIDVADRAPIVYGIIDLSTDNKNELKEVTQIAEILLRKKVIESKEYLKIINDRKSRMFFSVLADLFKVCKAQDSIFIFIDPRNSLINTYSDIFQGMISEIGERLPRILFILDGIRPDSPWLMINHPRVRILHVSSRIIVKTLTKIQDTSITCALFYKLVLNEFLKIYRKTNIDFPQFNIMHEDWEKPLLLDFPQPDLQPQIMSYLGYKQEEFEDFTTTRNRYLNDIGVTNASDEMFFFRSIVKLKASKLLTVVWLTKNGRLDLDLRIEHCSNHYYQWKDLINPAYSRATWIKLLGSLRFANTFFIGITRSTDFEETSRIIRFLKSVAIAWDVKLQYFLMDDFESSPIPIPENDVVLPCKYYGNTQDKQQTKYALKQEVKKLARFGKKYNETDWETKTNVHGLLLGINEYADKFVNLISPVNDVNKLYAACTESGLLKSTACTLLVNNEVKKHLVMQHLTSILSVAREDEIVLFYFSGYGINMANENKILFYDYTLMSKGDESDACLTAEEFRSCITAAKYNPYIILILETPSGSREWIDENNPKHFALMATQLEELCYETVHSQGTITDIVSSLIRENAKISYKQLLRKVIEAHIMGEKHYWQTPMFVVHKDNWNTLFLTAGENSTSEINSDLINLNKTVSKENLYARLYFNQEFKYERFGLLKAGLENKNINLSVRKYIDETVNVNQFRRPLPDIVFLQLDGQILPYSEPFKEIHKHLVVAFALDIPIFCLSTNAYQFQSLKFNIPWPVTIYSYENEVDINAVIDNVYEKTKHLIHQSTQDLTETSSAALVLGIDYKYETYASRNAERFRDWLVSPGGGRLDKKNVKLLTSGTEQWDMISLPVLDHVINGVNIEDDSTAKEILYIYICGETTSEQLNRYGIYIPNREEKNFFFDFRYIFTNLVSKNAYKKIIMFLDLEVGDIGTPVLPQFNGHSFSGNTIFSSAIYFQKTYHRRNERTLFIDSLLAGLEGEAINDAGYLTTDSLNNYLNSRISTDVVQQSLQFNANGNIEILSAELLKQDIYCQFADEYIGQQLVIRKGDEIVEQIQIKRKLEPSILPTGLYSFSVGNVLTKSVEIPINYDPVRVNLHWVFKKKWVLVVGNRTEDISPELKYVSNAIGAQLAKEGYGLVTGDWPGIVNEVFKAYSAFIDEERLENKGYINWVRLSNSNTIGYTYRQQEMFSTDWFKKAVNSAGAVILIEGLTGTETAFKLAQEADIPVIPIPTTGGFAGKAYEIMSDNRTLPMFMGELFRQITSPQEATDIARVVIKILESLDDKK
ncbi:hypothetical protein DVR12_03835 [Chitinophaga silvatica]|uniref:Peptidase C14 caspase domain-containing protein n=1 Tax=Chitinophaga silvatica TaxID=2282649 RepID=A0A3E1YHV0_9BACT|nr:caspase family protein [Chitinophaga silvatica]RFS26927.1 hypothetical protein DVR12_03835 [Chitinophaga silvatica]